MTITEGLPSTQQCIGQTHYETSVAIRLQHISARLKINFELIPH
jgi:hypothetical protein